MVWITCLLVLRSISPDASALPPWCQFSVSLWHCCMLPRHLTEKQLFWLWIGPSSLHSFRLSGCGMILVFVIASSSTHLLMGRALCLCRPDPGYCFPLVLVPLFLGLSHGIWSSWSGCAVGGCDRLNVLHPNWVGAAILSKNIDRRLRQVWH